tara:strand:- start:163 stop:822 length:660 start_codon:yes stop_codon:yes gene_type:complete
MSIVLENFNKVQADIRLKSKNIKNAPSLIAVSKTYPIEYIQPLIQNGHIHYGENKVQEAEKKWMTLKSTRKDIKLHMLGRLQTNKVKKAVLVFDYIHSLDSIRLANELIKNENQTGKKLNYFIQVNFADESQKSGISTTDVLPFFEYCSKKIKLNVVGLMCFPPFDANPTSYFKKALELNKKLGLSELSMGMSNDYLEAINFGSTFVRVGSAIFGKRGN